MHYGDLGKRIVAAIIDSFILGAFGYFLGISLEMMGIGIVAIIVYPLVSWMYFILMEGGAPMQHLGKRLWDCMWHMQTVEELHIQQQY